MNYSAFSEPEIKQYNKIGKNIENCIFYIKNSSSDGAKF